MERTFIRIDDTPINLANIAYIELDGKTMYDNKPCVRIVFNTSPTIENGPLTLTYTGWRVAPVREYLSTVVSVMMLHAGTPWVRLAKPEEEEVSNGEM